MTQTGPPYMPPLPTHLEIEVTPNGDGTFQTDLFCVVNKCGKQVTVWSDGPKTVHKIACIEHGVLSSFPDQVAFREYVRFVANKLLALNDEELIEADAFSIAGNDKTPPERMN